MSAAAAHSALLDGLFAAIDAKDAERFVGYLSDDATFRFGSAAEVSGRDAIRDAVGGLFEAIAGRRQEVSKVVAEGTTLFCEGDVTYTRHDNSRITLPFADVFELADGKIRGYKIYMDINPLYAE